METENKNPRETVRFLLKWKNKIGNEEELKLDLPYYYKYVDTYGDLTLNGEDFLEKHKKITEDEKINLGMIDNEEFFEDKIFIPKRLADFIKKRHIFKTPIDTEKIYVYNEGLYEPKGLAIIKNKARNILKEKSKKHYVDETIAHIRDTTHIDREEINNPKTKVLMENGILNLETLEVESFNPKYFFTFKVPILYNSNAECKLFLDWLDDVLLNVEWKRDVIQEFFGYCFLKDNRFQKALLCYGERRTRRSTLLKTLIQMLGRRNCRNYSLQTLTENDFALAYIHDKIANIVPDLSSRALRSTGVFMAIVGNDNLTSAKKGGHSFEFEPITKLIFSCNEIPRTPNKNLAFYRRWLIIKFENILPENEVDVNFEEPIASPLMTEEMLSGIFNWALEGLKRLLKNKRFSYPFDEHYVKELYEKASDSISSYIYNQILEDDLNKETKRDVYKHYKNYCEKEGLKIENQIKFGRLFKAITGCGISHIEHIPAYSGIKFKEKKDEQKKIE